MQITGHLTFFNINSCGIYRYAGKDPISCLPKELFALIRSWRTTVDFENSLPWSPKKNKPQCRLREIYKSSTNGDYILTLWKSDSDSTGQSVGVVEGEGTVITRSDKHLGKTVIWGKPCYYWVIPEYNLIASIKFEHSRTDSELFQDWIASVINNRIEIPGSTKKTTNNGYTQFVRTDDAKEGDSAIIKTTFRFDMSMKSIKTNDARLQELSQNTTHIIRKERIELTEIDDRPEILKLLGRIPQAFTKTPNEQNKLQRKVEIKIEAQPTPEEIKNIIESCSLEITPDDREFTNVGFITKRGGIKWADEFRMTESIFMDDLGHKILPSDVLYAKLALEREKYLNPIIAEMAREALLNPDATQDGDEGSGEAQSA
ncbi:MAG TPA: hypothetical protein DDW23_02750 [Planctomycetes bacterium]|nr:hypothetical protein [Planctomycetota bacterium]